MYSNSISCMLYSSVNHMPCTNLKWANFFRFPLLNWLEIDPDYAPPWHLPRHLWAIGNLRVSWCKLQARRAIQRSDKEFSYVSWCLYINIYMCVYMYNIYKHDITKKKTCPTSPPTSPPPYLNEFMSREIAAMHSHRMLMCIISTRSETHPTETSCPTALAIFFCSEGSMEKLKVSRYLIPSQVVNWIRRHWIEETLKIPQRSTSHQLFSMSFTWPAWYHSWWEMLLSLYMVRSNVGGRMMEMAKSMDVMEWMMVITYLYSFLGL